MKHTIRIEIENRTDLILAEAGVIKPETVRRATIEDALVDTGATRLSLPAPLIEQLGTQTPDLGVPDPRNPAAMALWTG